MEIGLVNTVVADDHVLFAAEEMARTIARNDPLALRLTKLALAQVTNGGPGLQSFESTAQAVLFESEEKFRRMDEFLKRRGGGRR
jgi:enoyl-CoA hydratase